MSSITATIASEWRNSYERGDLLAGEHPQLGQVGDECRTQRWANTWDAAQEVITLPPQRTLPQTVSKVGVNVLELLLQHSDDSVDALLDAPLDVVRERAVALSRLLADRGVKAPVRDDASVAAVRAAVGPELAGQLQAGNVGAYARSTAA